jgi:hypothetical protein
MSAWRARSGERLDTVLTRTILPALRLAEYGLESMKVPQLPLRFASAQQPQLHDAGVLGLTSASGSKQRATPGAPARRYIEAQIDAIVDDLAKAQFPTAT